MLPYKIALACVLLPLLTVHLTLFISIAVNNLEGCIPYWSRCHSISATGRQYPEFFVFKALMIPTAVLMMAYWLMLHLWLRKISAQQVNPMMITTLGLIAAAALIVYTVTLGAEGEPYALARRIGVIFYFSFSAFAHLLLLAKLQLLNMQALRIENEQNAMFWLCSVLVISGILSAVAGYLWVGWDNWDNAYEWWFSLIMIALFYVVGKMWKKTQFTVVFEIRKNGE